MVAKNWAEELPVQTIKDIVAVGDGHTLFEPKAYLDVGMPQEVVDRLKTIHRSERTIHYRALEAAQETARSYIEACINYNDTLEDLLESGGIEGMVQCVFEKLIEDDYHEVSAWCAKGSIWRNGKVVEEMEAVYGLDVVRAVADDLGVSYESKMGRGFQYEAIAKAINHWVDEGRSASSEGEVIPFPAKTDPEEGGDIC